MALHVQRAVAPDDLAVRRDDIGGAVGTAEHRKVGVIGLDHLLAANRDRELVAAFLDREFLQGLDIVGADPDDGGAHRVEFFGRLGKLVRLDRAARGEGLGIEIEYDRAFLERVFQVEGKRLAAEHRLGGEIHRLGPAFQRRHGRRCRDGGERTGGQRKQQGGFTKDHDYSPDRVTWLLSIDIDHHILLIIGRIVG